MQSDSCVSGAIIGVVYVFAHRICGGKKVISSTGRVRAIVQLRDGLGVRLKVTVGDQ